MSEKTTISKPESFSAELIDFFFSMPYNSIGKKDLQEYIVYLLKKYAKCGSSSSDKDKKFSDLTDLELQSLFRVDKRALRTIQNNVEIKYGKYEFTDKHLLTELMNLPRKNFKVKEGNVQLVIESGIVRNHLESKLKEICGTVFDYHNNPSMVIIEARLFANCLENLLESVDNNDGDFEKLKKNVKKLKLDDFVKKIMELGTVAVSTVSAAGSVANAPLTVITLLNKILEK